MTQRHREISGLTLIELLVYMALFTLLMNMVYFTFTSARSLNRRADAHLTDLQNAMWALEDIKGTARVAAAVTDSYREYSTGGQTLIIQSADKKHHVYELDHEYVQRLSFPDGGAQDKDVQIKRFPVKCESLVFEYDTDRPSDARLISVTLRLKRGKRVGGLGAAFSTKIFLRNTKR